MRALFASHTGRRMQIQDASINTNVPENPYARLMYYISTVQAVIERPLPNYLTDYSRWWSVTELQKLEILAVAVKLGPEKIPFFIEVNELPDNNSNMFLKLSTVEETVTALGIQQGDARITALRREIGNSENLVTVMAYTKLWALRNYYLPLKAIVDEKEAAEERKKKKKKSKFCSLL